MAQQRIIYGLGINLHSYKMAVHTLTTGQFKFVTDFS